MKEGYRRPDEEATPAKNGMRREKEEGNPRIKRPGRGRGGLILGGFPFFFFFGEGLAPGGSGERVSESTGWVVEVEHPKLPW